MPKSRTKLVYRSAVTGRFVRKAYLKGHTSKTVTEHVRAGRARKSR